jgi:hypothetical protein
VPVRRTGYTDAVIVGNRQLSRGSTPAEGGRLLRALIERKTPRPVDIARQGGFTRQYVGNVLAGRRRASPKFIEACRELGLPTEVIWGNPE